MALLNEFHQPQTLTEALWLLNQSGTRLVPLAGGTQLIGQLETCATHELDGVVDLSKLGLTYIKVDDALLRIGATTTLTDVIEHQVSGALADGILRKAAQGEGPVNFRNAATVGGVVAAAEDDSEFYAALLALDATVTLQAGEEARTTPLAQLASLTGLITEVQIPLVEQHSGHARVARTPADRPIVAAIAIIGANSERIALCGVAQRPILSSDPLDPPDNFKGSADYRRAMVNVVTQRALSQVKG
ncbi:MAG: FAD binding domain-containing protein [Caldilineaceae bacterium]